ncbi:MAG: hypothetical protein HY403_12370 [Elusimicrobia bacterium]|nr:hypothetical protein [Elusimicrobiota bacterium]
MKNLMLAFILLLSSLAAFGATVQNEAVFPDADAGAISETQKAVLRNSAMPYDVIKAKFDVAKGRVPSKEELRGRRDGRAFLIDRKTTPLEFAFVGREVENLPNGGPLFGKTFKTGFQWAFGDASMNASDTWLPEFGPDGVIVYAAYDFRYRFRYEIRAARQYLLVEIKAWDLQTGTNISSTGDVVGYAYLY